MPGESPGRPGADWPACRSFAGHVQIRGRHGTECQGRGRGQKTSSVIPAKRGWQWSCLARRQVAIIMKFSIEVGEAEKHTIDFNFNQLLGKLVIQVNRQEVKRSLRLIDEPVRETHVIELGGIEDLTVRIEKERRQLVGSKCRVFLNDRLYKFYEGM